MKKRYIYLMVALGSTLAVPLMAHDLTGRSYSFVAGFLHPFSGLDHFVAMIVVGIWAAMIAGRAFLALPLAFILSMIAGFGLALIGAELPSTEAMIAFSCLALGLIAVFKLRVPVAAAMGVVAGFGIFHGFAHGSETHGAENMPFLIGMVLATLILQIFGIFLVRLLGEKNKVYLQYLGGGVALLGAMLFISV